MIAKLRRITPVNLRAALWTLRALREVRRSLRQSGLNHVRVPDPPPVPHAGVWAVRAILRRLPETCLERALILQRWYAAHGSPRDVVIGVTPSRDFRAHAWLEGERWPDEFEELTRVHAA